MLDDGPLFKHSLHLPYFVPFGFQGHIVGVHSNNTGVLLTTILPGIGVQGYGLVDGGESSLIDAIGFLGR